MTNNLLIHLVTGPVGIGKSTLLWNYFKDPKPHTYGFISCRKSKTSREHFLLFSQEWIPTEPQDDSEERFSVGPYTFAKAAFDRSWREWTSPEKKPSNLYVLDELGKLEIVHHSGFEPHFSQWIQEHSGTLLLVVRSGLLASALAKYAFENVRINEGPWMPDVPAVRGLVLAGGASSRMGKNKALIPYHGVPQWEFAVQQIHALNLPVSLSAPVPLSTSIPHTPDADGFAGHGPISGVLSAFEEDPQTALLVLGVDYPHIRQQHLADLCYTYQIRNTSVAYRNSKSGRIEPLIALYHPKHLSLLKERFLKNQTSLSSFWEAYESEVVVLHHVDADLLKSHDIPADETAFRTR
jgi:molybdopterin-guanine dinucleotide biosynthesis protein A/nucleoside-triphosphatase THEP1